MEVIERSARARLLRALGWDGLDSDAAIFMLGLVSMQAASLLGVIERLTGRTPPEDLLITHPSINALARHVAEQGLIGTSDSIGSAHYHPSLGWQGEVQVQGKGFFIRRAHIEDAPALAALDASTWPPPLRGLSVADICARIQHFQAGQLVLCSPSGDIVGSLYTQRIASAAVIVEGEATFRDALTLHEDHGPVWQLLSVQVSPDLMSRGLGDVLINYALTVARASPGVHQAVAVTRCRTWAQAVKQQPSFTLEEHIQYGADPGLVFHTARGATVIALIPDWRAEDADNEGMGILIEYDLTAFRLVHDKSAGAGKQQGPAGLLEPKSSNLRKLDLAQEDLRRHVQHDIEEVVRSFVDQDVSIDTPLMDAGLDSYLMQNFVQARRHRGSAY